MKFFDMKKWDRSAVMGRYGVPPIFAGYKDDTTPMSGTDSKEQMKQFWNQTMLPEIADLQDRMLTEFARRWTPELTYKFNVSKVPELQVDIDKIRKQNRDDVKAGIMTQNEARISGERGDPVTWGNTWYKSDKLVDVKAKEITDETEAKETPLDFLIENQVEVKEICADNHVDIEKPLVKEIITWLYNQRKDLLDNMGGKWLYAKSPDEEYWEKQHSLLREVIDAPVREIIEKVDKDIDVESTKTNIVYLSHKMKKLVDGVDGKATIKELKAVYKMVQSKISEIARAEVMTIINGANKRLE